MRRECAPILGRPVACRTWCTCAKPVPPEHLSLRSFRTERDLVSSSWICWMCAVWQLQELSHEAETFLFLSCPLENRYCWFAQSVCVCVCPPNGFLFWFLYVFVVSATSTAFHSHVSRKQENRGRSVVPHRDPGGCLGARRRASPRWPLCGASDDVRFHQGQNHHRVVRVSW